MKLRRESRSRQQAEAGFTLLEVVIASVILIVSIGGMLASMLSSERLNRSNQERQLAIHAAESTIESLQGETFATLFVNFNGTTFDVDGLDPQVGAVAVGSVAFPTVAGVLREDTNDDGLGMPRDLNGDNVIDSDDRSGDYQILPVRVTVAWLGAAGRSQVELQTYLCNWNP